MLSCDQAVFFRREGKRKRIDREGMVLGSLHLTDLSFFDKLVKLLIIYVIPSHVDSLVVLSLLP